VLEKYLQYIAHRQVLYCSFFAFTMY